MNGNVRKIQITVGVRSVNINPKNGILFIIRVMEETPEVRIKKRKEVWQIEKVIENGGSGFQGIMEPRMNCEFWEEKDELISN